MSNDLAAPILVGLAILFGFGVSCGQMARCIRRKRSDDVSIVAWLAGAASCGCMVLLCFVTESSLWLAAWEGTGVAECLLAALVAWRYRSSDSSQQDATP